MSQYILEISDNPQAEALINFISKLNFVKQVKSFNKDKELNDAIKRLSEPIKNTGITEKEIIKEIKSVRKKRYASKEN